MKTRLFSKINLLIISYFSFFSINAVAQTIDEVYVDGYAKVTHKGKMGVINKQGKAVIPSVYKNIILFNKGIVKIEDSDNKYGCWDVTTNRQILQFKYDNLYLVDGSVDLIIGVIDGRSGLFTFTGKTVYPCKYDQITYADNGMTMISDNNKKGYINGKGEAITQIIYEEGSDFQYPGIAQVKFNGKWGWIDKTGKVLVPYIYDEMSNFRNVAIANKWGELDEYGKILIPCKYDTKLDFQSADNNLKNSKSWIQLNRKWGLINYQNIIIVPPKYDSPIGTPPCVAMVKGKWGLIGKSGKEITPFIYDHMNIESMKYNFFVLKGKIGMMNLEGKIIIPCKYSNIYSLPDSSANNILGVVINHKTGVINISGKQIIPLIYDSIAYYCKGMYETKLHGKWGFLDKNGEVAVGFKYDKTQRFGDGPAPVLLKGKWGFINKKGEVVIPFKYEDATVFFRKCAYVKLHNKWGGINKYGKIVIPFKYDTVDQLYQKYDTDEDGD
jgi:hypothetical protein